MNAKSKTISVFLSIILAIGFTPTPALAQSLRSAQSVYLSVQGSNTLMISATNPSSTKDVILYFDSASNSSKYLRAKGLSSLKAKWRSSKPKIASVSKKGQVTAKKAGTTTITATQGKKSYKFKIVSKKVTISKKKATVAIGGTLKLALNGDVIRSANSSNKGVASVSKSGSLKGLKAGTANITLISKKGKKYKCRITVLADTIAVNGISFKRSSLAFTKGDSAFSNPAAVSPANATNKKVNYRSSDKSIATITADGLVTPVGIGTTTLIATSMDGGKTATCKVSVTAKTVPVASVDFKLKSLTLGIDEPDFFNEAFVLPANATNQGLIYSSSNSEVVKVDQDGRFTPISIGSATVTAKSADGGKTAKCEVSIVSSFVPVSGITFSKKSLSMVAGGMWMSNSIVITPSNASNCSVLYESSDPLIATVDANGEISPLKEGSCVITALSYDGAQKAMCDVTVEKPSASNTGTLVVTASTTPVALGSTAKLTCTTSGSASSIQSVMWRSSADGGKTWTKCENEGSKSPEMNVIATEGGMGLQYQCVVEDASGAFSVSDPISLQVTGIVAQVSTERVKVGESANIKCTVAGANEDDFRYQWQTSDDAVVWSDIEGETSANLIVSASLKAASHQYRCILLRDQSVVAQSESISLALDTATPTISYRAHVRDIGWQGYVNGGETAGTTGRALRLEGLRVRLSYPNGSSAISYRAHVQNVGWQGWVSSEATTGTTGKSLQMEAVQLRLSGDYSNLYDIYYRVHVGDIGWLGWAKNGETAGSTGMNKQLEAVQIVLVEKGQKYDAGGIHELLKPKLLYQAHVAGSGWLSNVAEGAAAGTIGQNRQMEAVRINLKDFDGSSNGIWCRAHVSDVGWQNSYASSGNVSGTTGQGKRIECVAIQLAGNLGAVYDIYYRVHVADIGWMGWAKNNEKAGTTGGARQIEAIQIKLAVRGEAFNRGGAAYQNLAQSAPSAASAYDQAVSNFLNTPQWAHGATWAPTKTPIVCPNKQMWGCCAYVADFAKFVFGANSPTAGSVFYNPNEIRSGDIIWTGSHWFVVLYRNGNVLHVAEGNYRSRVNVSNGLYSVNGNTLCWGGGGTSFRSGYHFK